MPERAAGCLLGLAVGDALGTAVEGCSPGSFLPLQDMIGGGPYHLKPGQWTDDTAMALCLAESLVERGFDPADQVGRYVRWWDEGHLSATGKCIGLGATVRTALQRYLDTGEPWSGSSADFHATNGSLMRLAPVPIAFSDPCKAIHFSGESSRTTHQARAAVDACRYFGGVLWGLLRGAPRSEVLMPLYHPAGRAWSGLHPAVEEVARGSFRHRQPPELRASSYVVHTLEAALWAFARARDFRHGALLAVNLGDDADTTGAVYGQLAGANFGVKAIPATWLKDLAYRKRLEDFVARLLAAGL